MRLTTLRRITQVSFILLIFLMPALDIFRYDTAARELIVFGHVWSLGLDQALYADHSLRGASHIAVRFFLKAILPWIVFLSIFPLLGFLTGRLFCGWLCPEGALFELSDHLTLRLLGRRSLFNKRTNDPVLPAASKTAYAALALVTAIVIPLAGGIALTGYFVAPRTIWHQIISGEFTFGVKAGIIGVSIYMLITSILVRHVMCRFICAAGLMQMLLGWVSPVSMRLSMDTARAKECTDCKGCDRACFMNVLPRMQKRDISCVNCGACIDACNRELGPGKGLFMYRFGKGCAAPEQTCRGIEKAAAPVPMARHRS
ncbi:MAG: 4Fe-4S binding protein [Nitrospirae bacterium]|nr:MAG: 4Fe-4S binding protein [Nitrospirota bacterium]